MNDFVNRRNEHSHGGHQTQVDIPRAVELFHYLHSVLRLSVSIQPAVLQTLSHTVALQNI